MKYFIRREGFNWHKRIGYCKEVEYDDPCYSEDEDDEDEAEYGGVRGLRFQ